MILITGDEAPRFCSCPSFGAGWGPKASRATAFHLHPTGLGCHAVIGLYPLLGFFLLTPLLTHLLSFKKTRWAQTLAGSRGWGQHTVAVPQKTAPVFHSEPRCQFIPFTSFPPDLTLPLTLPTTVSVSGARVLGLSTLASFLMASTPLLSPQPPSPTFFYQAFWNLHSTCYGASFNILTSSWEP